MNTFGIDPAIADLMAQAAAAVGRNTAQAVNDKIRAIHTKRTDQEKIGELEQLVGELAADKGELARVVHAYEEQLVAQQLSDENIKYIIDNVVPVLKQLANQAVADAKDDAAEAQATQLRDGISSLEPLLSVQTLTILQLLGLNYRQAIGEPLTFLIRRLITSRAPLDPQDMAEINRMNAAFSLELAKLAQNKAATERWERLRDFRAPQS